MECIVTRASPPCNPIAVALSLSLLGLKSINACVRAGRSVGSFTRRYARSLNTLLRLDVGPDASALFRGGMDRTYVLECHTCTTLCVPDRGHDEARATRPISLIHRDLYVRRYGSIPDKLPKRNHKANVKSDKAPKVSRTVISGTTSSSQSSIATVAPAHQHVRNTPRGVSHYVTITGFSKSLLDQQVAAPLLYRQ